MNPLHSYNSQPIHHIFNFFMSLYLIFPYITIFDLSLLSFLPTFYLPFPSSLSSSPLWIVCFLKTTMITSIHFIFSLSNNWLPLFFFIQHSLFSQFSFPFITSIPFSFRYPPMWRRPWRCLASYSPKSTFCWPSFAHWKHRGPSLCETGATWPPSSWQHCKERWSMPPVSSNSSCLTSLTKTWKARTTQSSYSGGTKSKKSEGEGKGLNLALGKKHATHAPVSCRFGFEEMHLCVCVFRYFSFLLYSLCWDVLDRKHPNKKTLTNYIKFNKK